MFLRTARYYNPGNYTLEPRSEFFTKQEIKMILRQLSLEENIDDFYLKVNTQYFNAVS